MHAQSHPDMPRLTRGEFGWSGVSLATLEVIQNERLIEFFPEKLSFYHVLPSNECVGCVLVQSDCSFFFEHQYLWNEIINALDFLHRDS